MLIDPNIFIYTRDFEDVNDLTTTIGYLVNLGFTSLFESISAQAAMLNDDLWQDYLCLVVSRDGYILISNTVSTLTTDARRMLPSDVSSEYQAVLAAQQ